MGILSETLILTFGMGFFCLLPLFLKMNHERLRFLFLIGTGAMLGLCVFDLIPDVYELGGTHGLLITIAVGILYSVVHLIHIKHHDHLAGEKAEAHHLGSHGHGRNFLPFFLSLSGHCLASGMLLAVSEGYSARVGLTVFMALITHKGYESLTFTSILISKGKTRNKNLLYIGLYVLALPAGVLLTSVLGSNLNQLFAMYISAIAVGSLIGCLLFDFLLPCFHHVRTRKYHLAWLIVGLIITQFIMRHL